MPACAEYAVIFSQVMRRNSWDIAVNSETIRSGNQPANFVLGAMLHVWGSRLWQNMLILAFLILVEAIL